MRKLEYDSTQKLIYCSSRKEPFFVDVPAMNYLCFDGSGHPEEEDFQVACEALYTFSYIIKFDISRKQLDTDYKVNPMEVKWYLDKSGEKTEFTWTMMIMQPDFITEGMVEEAMKRALAKEKHIASDRVYYKNIKYGRCIQCFHRGDYNLMNDTLKRMQDFAHANGYDSEQYTQDIYLNDMRKTKVENYKTIMRVKIRSLTHTSEI